jgi:hypothetical protein
MLLLRFKNGGVTKESWVSWRGYGGFGRLRLGLGWPDGLRIARMTNVSCPRRRAFIEFGAGRRQCSKYM